MYCNLHVVYTCIPCTCMYLPEAVIFTEEEIIKKHILFPRYETTLVNKLMLSCRGSVNQSIDVINDREIKRQITKRCYASRIRRFGLGKEQVTFEDIIKGERNLEASENQAATIEKPAHTEKPSLALMKIIKRKQQKDNHKTNPSALIVGEGIHKYGK